MSAEEMDREQTKSHVDRWIALGLLLGFLILYLRTLCPTVYMGDAGEICTAIATGGVIHPPGYPLFSLLGRIALILLPGGEPAFRIGCLVTLAAAAAIAGLYGLAREIGGSRWAAAAAAAAFGVSHTFWAQSTRVEVYSLHALLACLTLWAGLRYRRTGRLRDLAALALAGSLGLAHHLTIVLLLPGLLMLCGRRLWTDPGPGRRVLALVGLMPVGPALYLFLMIWARSEPLQNWGRPVNLPLLWNHASARFYHGSLRFPDGPHLWQRLAKSGSLFTDTFPTLTFVLPLIGAWMLWKRDRGIAGALLIALMSVVAFNLCYGIGDIAAYYLAAWIIAASLMALPLAAVGRLGGGSRGSAVLAVGVSLLLVGISLGRNWASCDLSRATWVREFARHKLENVEPDGILISAPDNDTFPLWYVHELLGVRPDVFQIDRVMTSGVWLNYDRDPSLWYLHRLRRQGANIAVPVTIDLARREYLGNDGYLINLLNAALRGRPVSMTFFASNAPGDRRVLLQWAARHYQVVPIGLLMRLQPRGCPVNLHDLVRENERQWASIALPDLRGVRTDDELDQDYIAHHYACSLVNFGGLYEMAGDTARAEAQYGRAAAWAPDYRPAREAMRSLRSSKRFLSKKAASAEQSAWNQEAAGKPNDRADRLRIKPIKANSPKGADAKPTGLTGVEGECR